MKLPLISTTNESSQPGTSAERKASFATKRNLASETHRIVLDRDEDEKPAGTTSNMERFAGEFFASM